MASTARPSYPGADEVGERCKNQGTPRAAALGAVQGPGQAASAHCPSQMDSSLLAMLTAGFKPLTPHTLRAAQGRCLAPQHVSSVLGVQRAGPFSGTPKLVSSRGRTRTKASLSFSREMWREAQLRTCVPLGCLAWILCEHPLPRLPHPPGSCLYWVGCIPVCVLEKRQEGLHSTLPWAQGRQQSLLRAALF